MMIQQISAASPGTSSAGQSGSGRVQNTDGFRSKLKDAVSDASASGQKDLDRAQDAQKSAVQGQNSKADKAGDSEKTGGSKKKDQIKKTDGADQDQTDTGQTQKSAFSPGTSVLLNEAALFVSGKDQPAAAGISDSGGESTAVVSGPAAEVLPQTGMVAGKEAPKSAQTIGGQTAVSGTEENKNAGEKTAVIPNSGPQKLQKSDSGRQRFAAASSPDVNQGQKPSGEKQTRQADGAQAKTLSAVDDGADKTAQPAKAQAGASQTRTPEPKESSANHSDGGFQALYGDGKVVIKVSGEAAAKETTPVRQVANEAIRQMQQGKTEFQMDLYPKSLGKVSVKLTSQDGLLTVEIAASDPKTQSLLMSGSSEIRSILQASAGQNVQTVIPDRQAQQWYRQDGGDGGYQENQRQKQDESSRKNRQKRIESVSANLSAGDFISMMQKIAAYAR